MAKIKGEFDKRVLIKAKELMQKTFQEFRNSIFTFMESRFLSLTDEILNIEGKLKGSAMNISIKVFKFDDKSPDLFYKENFDSGLDIASTKDVILQPFEETLVPCGIAIAVPIGYETQLRGRSSNKKFHVKLGTIDNGFRNEIKIALMNLSNDVVTIKAYEPIAQLVINKIAYAKKISYVDSLDKLPKSSRDKGGFGSTAKTISVPFKELDLKNDDLLQAVDIIHSYNYELPIIVDNLIEVKNVYLNQNIIKGVTKIISDKVKHVENNVFMIGEQQSELVLNIDSEGISFSIKRKNVESVEIEED